MAEQFLDDPEVRTAVEQVGRRRVTEGVWPVGPRRLAEEPRRERVDGASTKPTPTGTKEYRGTRVRGGQRRPPVRKPSLESRCGGHAVWQDPLFRALPEDTHRVAGAIEVIDVEADELTHAEPSRVEQLNHRKIPDGHGVPRIGRGVEAVEEGGDLLPARHLGEPPVRTW